MGKAEVFVDTAGFLALWDRGDGHHKRAAAMQKKLAAAKRGFMTTDYVLDETATLLRMRHSHAAAADFLVHPESSCLRFRRGRISIREGCRV